jgi:hypothetical protein
MTAKLFEPYIEYIDRNMPTLSDTERSDLIQKVAQNLIDNPSIHGIILECRVNHSGEVVRIPYAVATEILEHSKGVN